VTSPGANVPISIAAGTFAGAVVNMALVEEDFVATAGEGRNGS
jgi:hypothetical protein